MSECYRCNRRFRFGGTAAPMAVREEKQSGSQSLAEVSCLRWALSRYASALRKSSGFLPPLRYYAGSHNGSKLSTVSWESDRVRLKTSRGEERECATRNFIPTHGGARRKTVTVVVSRLTVEKYGCTFPYCIFPAFKTQVCADSISLF